MKLGIIIDENVIISLICTQHFSRGQKLPVFYFSPVHITSTYNFLQTYQEFMCKVSHECATVCVTYVDVNFYHTQTYTFLTLKFSLLKNSVWQIAIHQLSRNFITLFYPQQSHVLQLFCFMNDQRCSII